MARLHLILKALRELGPRQLGLYAWYQVLLRSGFLRWWTRVRGRKTGAASHRSSVIRPVLSLPSPHEIKDILGDSGITEITKSANEIVEGKFRRFGEKPVPIELTPPGVLTHWIDYELGRVSWGAADPKFIWEPARFGWVFSLGQAYLITEDERYPEVFWQNYENFISANPLNQGPNWTSAQEVALRVLAFVFAGQLFAKSIKLFKQLLSFAPTHRGGFFNPPSCAISQNCCTCPRVLSPIWHPISRGVPRTTSSG